MTVDQPPAHSPGPAAFFAPRLTILGLIVWLFVAQLCVVACTPAPADGDRADAVSDALTSDAALAETDGLAAAAVTQQRYAASALKAAQGITLPFLMDRINALASDEFGGRDNLSAGGQAARAWLEADLTNLALPPAVGSAYAQPFAAGVNLCAKLPGHDPALASEVVVIGAHYDHLGTVGAPNSQCKPSKLADPTDKICNGAVDNAAGVAVAIAVLHALATSAQPPRRSIVLCLFDAEEDGLLGSRHFVDKAPLVPLTAIAAMFSVDNIGSEFLPGETSSFATDVEYSVALRAAVKTANDLTGMQTWPVSSFFVGQDGGGRSDHQPFREAGIPVLFIGSGSSPAYHTPADEVGIINQPKLLNIARHTAVLVALIANAPTRPDFVPQPAPHIDDAVALVSLADRVIAAPQALGLSDAQLDLVKGWRTDLAAWITHPPTTSDEWDTYQGLVKAILAAVYLFAG